MPTQHSHLAVSLVPDHAIVTWITRSEATNIKTIAMASLSWSAVGKDNSASPISAADFLPTALTIIPPRNGLFSGTPSYPVELAVRESPLQSGTYRVWLHIPSISRGCLGDYVECAFLYRFTLSLPGLSGSGLAWRQGDCLPAQPHARYSGITYSGYNWSLGRLGHELIAPGKPPVPISFANEPRWWNWAHLAPYGGALTYHHGKDEPLVVHYFE
jgi:hypothetical protein